MIAETCRRAAVPGLAHSPKIRGTRKLLLLLALGLYGPLCAAAPLTRPNIVIILADDLGYSDVGCFGGEVATPNIDRLANEGVRFTRLYNCGMCVISRTSLLTGQWWPRGERAFRQTPLLSERLGDAGYRTALIGKWHLPGHPLDRGFGHFFGFLAGFADHFAGAPSYRLDRKPFTDFGTDYLSTDAFADRATAFIRAGARRQRGERQPFFLYLAFQAPHNPLQAPRADILRYRGRYAAGWQAVREARFRRQQAMGIVPANATLPDYPQNLPNWNTLSLAQRDLEDLRMAVYAAMVERMDAAIGRVRQALTDVGEDRNTLVLFASDNGSDSFAVMDEPLLRQGKLPGDPHSNWQPGTGWAYASVTPWRLYKISQHGGGVTTGAVAWWPGHTGAPGRIAIDAIDFSDVLPTVLEAAGAPVGPGSISGESFLPRLAGNAWQRREPLYFQFMDNRAVRTAEWTLAEVDGAGWELFRRSDDPFENQNLAAEHPAKVAELDARWLAWWRSESGQAAYTPKSTRSGPHYKPQGDRGSGNRYVPSAMPEALADRYPAPALR